MALCPDCAQPIAISEANLVIGDIVTCEECGAQLEVVSLNELELQPVWEEGELDEDLLSEGELQGENGYAPNDVS